MAGAGKNNSSPDLVNSNSNTEGDCTVTKNEYSDGSISFTVTINWGKNKESGVSKETTRTGTFDSDGNIISMIEITEFSKPDHGTVEVHTVITGNLTTTWYWGKDEKGNEVFTGHVEDISVIGLRGWGTGLKTTDGKDSYDDMLILITANGDIGVFDTCNFEHTNATSYVDAKGVKHGLTPDRYNNFKDGRFGLNYGWHNESYAAIWVNNNLAVPGIPNTMYGVQIHRGGLDWNWSQGCITIFDPKGNGDFSRFMSYFEPNPIATNPRTGINKHDEYDNYLGVKTHQRAGELIIGTL